MHTDPAATNSNANFTTNSCTNCRTASTDFIDSTNTANRSTDKAGIDSYYGKRGANQAITDASADSSANCCGCRK